MSSQVVRLKFKKISKVYIIIISKEIIFNLNFLIQQFNFVRYLFKNSKLKKLINFYVNIHEML